MPSRLLFAMLTQRQFHKMVNNTILWDCKKNPQNPKIDWAKRYRGYKEKCKKEDSFFMVSGINFCPLLDVKDAVIVILSIDKHVGRYYFSALKPELIKRNRFE